MTSSVVGKITALDGTTATLQLGELTESQPGDPPSQDGTQPSGDNAKGDSSASGQTNQGIHCQGRAGWPGQQPVQQ